MAAAPQTGRKLSVVDTLDHARRTLSTHRRWLRRQVSSDKCDIREEDETLASMARAPEEKEEGEMKGEKRSPTRAPPTLLPRSQGPVQTVQTAREWIEFLQQKRITAKVAPSPTLESVEEEDEDEGGKGGGGILSRGQAWSSKESPARTEEQARSGNEEHLQKDKSHRLVAREHLFLPFEVPPLSPPLDPTPS